MDQKEVRDYKALEVNINSSKEIVTFLMKIKVQVNQAKQVSQGNQAHLDHLEKMVIPVKKVVLVTQVYQEHQDFLELVDHQVFQVVLVFRESKEHKYIKKISY